MKTSQSLSLFFASLTVLALNVQAQDQRYGTVDEPTATAQEVPAQSPTVTKLGAFTYEQRAAFIQAAQALAAQSDATMVDLNTNYNEMEASPKRREVMAFVKTAQADFKDKVSAADNLTPETFETIKSNVISSWERYEDGLKKARAVKS